jgi:cytochrome c
MGKAMLGGNKILALPKINNTVPSLSVFLTPCASAISSGYRRRRIVSPQQPEDRTMKHLLTSALAALTLATMVPGPAGAAEPTEKDAIAMAEKGAAFMRANGKEALIGKLAGKDPAFVQGELYVDMRDLHTGIVLAHPINPSIVGKNLLDVPDASGKVYRREIIELAAKSGKGWVDYLYRNPVSGKIEPKTTYILRVGDVVLEAGIYKN